MRACVRVRARQDLTAITPPPPPSHTHIFAGAACRSRMPMMLRACYPGTARRSWRRARARVCASDLSGSDIDSDADLCSDLRS